MVAMAKRASCIRFSDAAIWASMADRCSAMLVDIRSITSANLASPSASLASTVWAWVVTAPARGDVMASNLEMMEAWPDAYESNWVVSASKRDEVAVTACASSSEPGPEGGAAAAAAAAAPDMASAPGPVRARLGSASVAARAGSQQRLRDVLRYHAPRYHVGPHFFLEPKRTGQRSVCPPRSKRAKSQ